MSRLFGGCDADAGRAVDAKSKTFSHLLRIVEQLLESEVKLRFTSPPDASISRLNTKTTSGLFLDS